MPHAARELCFSHERRLLLGETGVRICDLTQPLTARSQVVLLRFPSLMFTSKSLFISKGDAILLSPAPFQVFTCICLHEHLMPGRYCVYIVL